MGMMQCCFLRDRDEQKSIRTQMIKDYLTATEKNTTTTVVQSEFKDLALSEAANISVQSIDDSISQNSV
ncbi:hypothetical protein SteCoe_26419 [Stentor coeruleus]|uniref:Uncharacterized protein n=1 Tax=Stentor coeruleus TaxID=5963 RepID=A0A1R2BCU6_9CILI|nr:hypothetical protein SteCoe_26419 [Stentor coeruleus]